LEKETTDFQAHQQFSTKYERKISREGYKPFPLGYTIFCVKNQVIILFLKRHNAMPCNLKACSNFKYKLSTIIIV
jgi:hypothetical protein